MILFLDSVHPYLEENAEVLGLRPVFFFNDPLNIDPQICPLIKVIVIRSRCPMDKQRIDLFPELKIIARAGAGMENIDIDYCHLKNIICVNSPEGNRDAVGEQALGMLLMLMNHLRRADSEVRSCVWHREQNRGYELKGKKTGIIGYGNMGRAFAEKLAGMGTEVIAFDKYKSGFAHAHVHEVNLDELFAEADIVSMHVPLTEETRYMCDQSFFISFAKPIFYINTSRGMVCKTSALLEAVEMGKVKGAALDVLEWEDYSFENFFNKTLPAEFEKLKQDDRFVLSPHIAGWTHESHLKHSQILFEKIQKILNV